MKLVERIQIRKILALSELCHRSKNIYNEANYTIRQEFFRGGKWIRYNKLYHLLKTSPNYKDLPAQTAQQILKLLDKSWKSFFKAIKDWKKHPEKYLGRPRPPKYKSKNGEHVVIFTNQQCKILDGYLTFPKKADLPPLKTRVTGGFHQVRILPRGAVYVVEVVHGKAPCKLGLDPNRIIGIDMGVTNLITGANNAGLQPFVIRGGTAKSINAFYNKQRARFTSIKDKQGYKFETRRLQRQTLKRNNKIRDFFHKVSKWLIDYCIEHDFGKIVLGYNKRWKQKVNIGKYNNQNFVSIPFRLLRNQIEYKARLVGIEVVAVLEDYTSKCSFLDGEEITHHERYLGKRISRGLFKSKNGILIHSDVNGAYNILRKAVPEAFLVDGIEGVGLHPCSFESLHFHTKELDQICQT